MRYPFRLCLITNRHLVKDRPLIEIAKLALEGGVDCILLREKDLNPKTLLYVARQFKMLVERYSAKLIISDRVDVAQIVDAHGVHLSADSIPPQDAKKIFKGLVGYSAHSAEEAKAMDGKVDYLFLSPIFPTRSKPMAKPLGVEYFQRVRETLKTPVYPLGGINTENIFNLGRVEGVAAMSVFFGAQSPKEAAQKMMKAIGGS